ncbi:MAG: ABC transporter ATP-binding protein [Desulfobacteraceae bacterium]|nr:MAG: ABC transporter ATP-binding protein [Desulfobacteraceae bacterium]
MNASNTMICIENAAFAYGRQMVWQDLNLEVRKGDLMCLLGANGCGKTTLLNCLHGDLRLASGQISIEGTPIHTLPALDIARTIGVVFQEYATSFPYTVLDVVLMGRGPHLSMFSSPTREDRDIALSCLKNLGVLKLRDKKFTRISGGEKQLVLIARTLCQKPRIILMDEPTASLDFKNQALVLGMIRKLTDLGLTIIMTSHFPNHALLCADRVALMNDHTLVDSGDTRTIMTESNLKKTYDIDVRILSVNDPPNQEMIKFCMPSIRPDDLGDFSKDVC